MTQLMGETVSHLVCRVMNARPPGGNENIRPVVWERQGGMVFALVQADMVSNVLGTVSRSYRDLPELINDIANAHVRWGIPTREMLEQAFPREESLRPVR